MTPSVITLDFETDPIDDRPNYPPVPKGYAVRYLGGSKVYIRWGHPTGNNCTLAEGLAHLRELWHFALDNNVPILFHHAKFDVGVATEKLGFPMLPWKLIHDTTFILFLLDPHAKKHDLKGTAERILNMPPEEKDAIGDYVLSNRERLAKAYPHVNELSPIWTARGSIQPETVRDRAGAWIGYCPGDLVDPYACGDVDRTWQLFDWLYPKLVAQGMLEAYDREREVLPIFMENERDGICVDTAALSRDIPAFQRHMEEVDAALRNYLGLPSLNLDSNDEMAEALSRAGLVDDDKWVRTAGGGKSMSKDNLSPEMFNDPLFAHALGYRNRLQTCLGMFMEPWLKQALLRDGKVSTNWNQTRGGDGGTRTGRPSTSNPNFLNISKDFESKKDGYVHPDFLSVPRLPLVRKYMLPDPDGVWLHRDFNGQELRVFAHFECGPLQRAYLQNPRIDPHGDVVKPVMEAMAGREFERTDVKILNFLALYGGGAPAAAKRLKRPVGEAKEFLRFHADALPGRGALNDVIKEVVRRGDPIRTWGGRLYYVEPPGYNKKHKKHMTYEYKLLNYLVQGSAADITKQTMIDWYNNGGRQARFLVQVYDEMNISAHRDIAPAQMAILREMMEIDRMSVKMLSDGKWGPRWGELTKYEEAA